MIRKFQLLKHYFQLLDFFKFDVNITNLFFYIK